jgi:hypothetical protein
MLIAIKYPGPEQLHFRSAMSGIRSIISRRCGDLPRRYSTVASAESHWKKDSYRPASIANFIIACMGSACSPLASKVSSGFRVSWFLPSFQFDFFRY